MITALFLAILAATLAFGGWLAVRLSRADKVQRRLVADAARATAINDEAENGWAR